MTLTLVSAGYRPPTGYSILADPNFPLPEAAFQLYTTIEQLVTTGWLKKLEQYGIHGLEWRGMLDNILSADTPDTILMMLPRGPGGVPGFMTEWQAYHNFLAPNTVFAWLPASLSAYGPATIDLNQWMVGATHELMEALTDAEPGNGWVNQAENNEGADDCQGIPFKDTTVSAYWLNDLNRCFTVEDF